MSNQNTLIGKVAALYRYPVKAMAAEALTAANVSWFGIAGDRRWAFVREAATSSGFPWLTIRQRRSMAHYQPTLTDPERPDQSSVQVETPSGDIFDITDARLADQLYPGNGQQTVYAIKQSRGIFDTFPLSLITTQTIKQLGGAIGRELNVQRFRPNFLVEAKADHAEYPEDHWVGRILRIGTSRLRIDKRDSRCGVINVDPETGQSDPNILKTVTQDRDGCLGVYATPVHPGQVAIGDSVYLEG